MKVAAASLLVSALVLLAGCAPGGTGTDTPSQASAPPPAAAPQPTIGPTTLPDSLLVTVGHRSSDSERVTTARGAKLKVYDNVSLAGVPQVDRALVVIHGTGRNGGGYFDRAMSAARSAGADGHTIVVAPQFNESTWSDEDWKDGGGRTSSFEVMDNILASLADQRRFPNLKHITIVGHSAGGQFTQRYATFGKAPNALPWVPMNFVIMNPSSFVYFGPERPNADGSSFAIPPAGCAGYNTYKYGLDGRSGYVGELSNEQAAAQYLSRRVTIVNGGADSFDNGDLDSSCAANLEGPHRLARGQFFYNHLHTLHPNAPHDYVVVPGVDHDSEEMLGSDRVRPMLFSELG